VDVDVDMLVRQKSSYGSKLTATSVGAQDRRSVARLLCLFWASTPEPNRQFKTTKNTSNAIACRRRRLSRTFTSEILNMPPQRTKKNRYSNSSASRDDNTKSVAIQSPDVARTPEREPAQRGAAITLSQKQALIDNLQLESKNMVFYQLT
jgi:hypothetical protein